MHKNTYVIVPVYNEAKVISGVIEELSTRFRNIICVDDGSTDLSALVIKDTKATLVQHKKNRGQGAALQTGIDHALKDTRAEYFITFDADGQHSVSDAEKMLRYIQRQQLDVILGSRFLGGTSDMPRSRKALLKLAIAFTRITTGLGLTDTHNGLRVFNRHTAAKLKLTCSGMAHASEIIYRIADKDLSYAEFPVVIRYTDYSKQKGQSWTNMFNILFELTKQRTKAWWTD